MPLQPPFFAFDWAGDPGRLERSAAMPQPGMNWPQENAKDRKEETTQALLFTFLALLYFSFIHFREDF